MSLDFVEVKRRTKAAKDYYALADVYASATTGLNDWEKYLFALTTTNELQSTMERGLFSTMREKYPSPEEADRKLAPVRAATPMPLNASPEERKVNRKAREDAMAALSPKIYGTRRTSLIDSAIDKVSDGCASGDCKWPAVSKAITTCDPEIRVNKRGVVTKGSRKECGVPGGVPGLVIKGCELARLISGCQVPVIDLHMIELVADAKGPEGKDFSQLWQQAEQLIAARDDRRMQEGSPATKEVPLIDPTTNMLLSAIQGDPDTYDKYKAAAIEMAQEQGHGHEAGRWHVAEWLKHVHGRCMKSPGKTIDRTPEQSLAAAKTYLLGTTEVLVDPEVRRQVSVKPTRLLLPCPI